jgi:hypothetical protein
VVSPGELLVQVKVDRKAARGPRNVTVTNPNRKAGVGRKLFKVS